MVEALPGSAAIVDFPHQHPKCIHVSRLHRHISNCQPSQDPQYARNLPLNQTCPRREKYHMKPTQSPTICHCMRTTLCFERHDIIEHYVSMHPLQIKEA